MKLRKATTLSYDEILKLGEEWPVRWHRVSTKSWEGQDGRGGSLPIYGGPNYPESCYTLFRLQVQIKFPAMEVPLSPHETELVD